MTTPKILLNTDDQPRMMVVTPACGWESLSTPVIQRLLAGCMEELDRRGVEPDALDKPKWIKFTVSQTNGGDDGNA